MRKRHDWNLVFYSSSGGYTGRFSQIVKCKEENGQLLLETLIGIGDRAINGTVDIPFFDSKDTIYFKTCISLDALASKVGIDKKIIANSSISSCAQDYWNNSTCAYNLQTKRFEILSININYGDCFNSKVVEKILLLMNFSKNKHIHVTKQNLPTFFEKFKKACLNYAKQINS